MRRWSAKIHTGGWNNDNEGHDARESASDLKADQIKSAIHEAVGELGYDEVAAITIYKTTRNGTVRDDYRSIWMRPDGRAIVHR